MVRGFRSRRKPNNNNKIRTSARFNKKGAGRLNEIVTTGAGRRTPMEARQRRRRRRRERFIEKIVRCDFLPHISTQQQRAASNNQFKLNQDEQMPSHHITSTHKHTHTQRCQSMVAIYLYMLPAWIHTQTQNTVDFAVAAAAAARDKLPQHHKIARLRTA